MVLEEVKILVPVKRMVDQRESPSQVGQHGWGHRQRQDEHLSDEIAVEEAMRPKETDLATEVVVSCGVAHCQKPLSTAMAIGTDRAILSKTDLELRPLAVTKLLRPEQSAGRADRQDRGAAVVHRRRHQRGDPAPSRHQGVLAHLFSQWDFRQPKLEVACQRAQVICDEPRCSSDASTGTRLNTSI